jgi:hypothetical protein
MAGSRLGALVVPEHIHSKKKNTYTCTYCLIKLASHGQIRARRLTMTSQIRFQEWRDIQKPSQQGHRLQRCTQLTEKTIKILTSHVTSNVRQIWWATSWFMPIWHALRWSVSWIIHHLLPFIIIRYILRLLPMLTPKIYAKSQLFMS